MKNQKPSLYISKTTRNENLCECGCGQQGHDYHHCLIGRRKGIAILNDKRNLARVNHDEHISRKFDTLEWRRKFWKIQCQKYGEAAMLEWVAEVKRTTKLTSDRFAFMCGTWPQKG